MLALEDLAMGLVNLGNGASRLIRLVDGFFEPSFVIAVDEEEEHSQTASGASVDRFRPPTERKLSRKNASFLDSMKMNDTLTVRWFASRDFFDKPTGRFGLIHPTDSSCTVHEESSHHSHRRRLA